MKVGSQLATACQQPLQAVTRNLRSPRRMVVAGLVMLGDCFYVQKHPSWFWLSRYCSPFSLGALVGWTRTPIAPPGGKASTDAAQQFSSLSTSVCKCACAVRVWAANSGTFLHDVNRHGISEEYVEEFQDLSISRNWKGSSRPRAIVHEIRPLLHSRTNMTIYNVCLGDPQALEWGQYSTQFSGRWYIASVAGRPGRQI